MYSLEKNCTRLRLVQYFSSSCNIFLWKRGLFGFGVDTPCTMYKWWKMEMMEDRNDGRWKLCRCTKAYKQIKKINKTKNKQKNDLLTRSSVLTLGTVGCISTAAAGACLLNCICLMAHTPMVANPRRKANAPNATPIVVRSVHPESVN